MHGQKKRRKRTISGEAEFDGIALVWELLSEPMYIRDLFVSSGNGRKGLCISVRAADQIGRELLVEFPYPTNKEGKALPVPQRPPLTQIMVEKAILEAGNEGWHPSLRGKAFRFFAN